MWGGATFDTALRFLHEDPWQRLRQLRQRIPNICFQMLLRGANAVGYASYPDNVIEEFVREAHAQGIDIFRIFDSLNSIENMRVAIDAVLETGAVCEPGANICYTGDILDKGRPKYSLKYYVGMAKQLEKTRRAFPSYQRYGLPACASRTPPSNSFAPFARKSPSPFISTRTTPAA